MHTTTINHRFKVGDKITDGNITATIAGVGFDSKANVYYTLSEYRFGRYDESELARYHLAPRFAAGDKVWYNTFSGIREDIVTKYYNNGSYGVQNTLLSCYTEDQLFPTAEACRAAIKVIPLKQ